MEGLFSSGDDRLNHKWGRLFASPWDDVVSEMASRAAASGLTQRESERQLSWMREGTVLVRFVFIEDPSNFDAVGRIFADESNAVIPACFVIVRQPDESETRGDIVFDIFRLSPKSYLWHFHRVYTPPTRRGAT